MRDLLGAEIQLEKNSIQQDSYDFAFVNELFNSVGLTKPVGASTISVPCIYTGILQHYHSEKWVNFCEELLKQTKLPLHYYFLRLSLLLPDICLYYAENFERLIYSEESIEPYHQKYLKKFLFLVFNGVSINETDQYGDNSLDSMIYFLRDLDSLFVQKYLLKDPLYLFLKDHSQSFGYKKFTTEELPMQELQDKILEGKLPINFPVEHCNSSLPVFVKLVVA